MDHLVLSKFKFSAKIALSVIAILLVANNNTVFAKTDTKHKQTVGSPSSYTTRNCGMSFLENKGQITDQKLGPRPDIHYKLATGEGLTIFIGAGFIQYQFCKMEPIQQNKLENKDQKLHQHNHSEATICNYYRMDVALVGANKSAEALASETQGYYETYYTPGTGENGVTSHTFNRITYKEIYPNIDWVLYISNGQLKHEFVVHNGGKAGDIQLKYDGAKNLQLMPDGTLRAQTPLGDIIEQAPVSWQNDGVKISSRFKLNGNLLGYEIGSYSGELVIDPGLVWATYYGGSQDDYTTFLLPTAAGDIYMSGCTRSTSMIATVGAHQQTFVGASLTFDGFIAKFDNNGNRMWATYYGGSQDDHTNQLAIDNSEYIYIVGYTSSPNGIATSGTHKDIISSTGLTDAFFAKFNAAGVRQWGSYFGGNGNDRANSIAIDGVGNFYIVGETHDTNEIASLGAHQTVFGGDSDGFLVKFNSTGVKQWGTYYGGTTWDNFSSIVIDAGNNIYASGHTLSTNSIATAGSHQATYGGDDGIWGDCFLVKFNSSGVRDWSTYYGGTDADYGCFLDVGNTGDIYLSGSTKSTSGIATTGSHKAVIASTDCYLVKFNSLGTRIWGTYFGGNSVEEINAITIDATNNIFIGGITGSTVGLSTPGAYKEVRSGLSDGFFAFFNSSGVLQFSTYFGGSDDDLIRGLTSDGYGNLYVAGSTNSKTGVATAGAFDTSYSGISTGGLTDAFLAKFNGFPTSINDDSKMSEASLFLYPNPTKANVTVAVEIPGVLQIISVDGRMIGDYKIFDKSIIQLPKNIIPGLYFCRFFGDNGTTTVRQLYIQ